MLNRYKEGCYKNVTAFFIMYYFLKIFILPQPVVYRLQVQILMQRNSYNNVYP